MFSCDKSHVDNVALSNVYDVALSCVKSIALPRVNDTLANLTRRTRRGGGVSVGTGRRV